MLPLFRITDVDQEKEEEFKYKGVLSVTEKLDGTYQAEQNGCKCRRE